MGVKDLTLHEDSFVSLLGKLIGETKYLQNNPPDHIPKEDRAGRHVLDVLNPLRSTPLADSWRQPHGGTENGGPLLVRHISYAEGRGNIIVEYPGNVAGRVVSFVGCHLDVVTANPQDWDFDPFSLTRHGDQLRGRGTTDCLGHVALLTDFFRQLALTRPPLSSSVVGVFIANEENATAVGIGVDALVKEGQLDHLKGGPLFWLDTADKQPCIGTGGMSAWTLKVFGKIFHSGLPHKSINPLELAMDSLSEIQKRFYADFPPHPEEARYGFATSSTLKPTQWAYPGGSVNQIPGECTISGDIRMTPFYDVDSARSKIVSYVTDINAHLDSMGQRGPWSKYTLPLEGLKGNINPNPPYSIRGVSGCRVELVFEEVAMKGVACDLDSPGFHALCKATKEVVGHVEPYSITGSLPCIRELQEEGFDVQTMGYGLMPVYHAKNEYCLLSDFAQGFRVLANIVHQFNP